MARRQLLTDEERTALLGIPADPDSLARLFTRSRADRALVVERRGDANRLGCAVQLALLRHPGTAFAYLDQPVNALATWMASHLDIPATAFDEYARQIQAIDSNEHPDIAAQRKHDAAHEARAAAALLQQRRLNPCAATNTSRGRGPPLATPHRSR